jgi:hypothetical protein
MKQFTYWPSKGYSQNGEEEILADIIDRIGIQNGFFVEVGAMDGITGSNTRALAEKGWSGLMIEGNQVHIPKLIENTQIFSNIKTLYCKVSCEQDSNLDFIFQKMNIPKDFDFLSIDIDGNDYWVWKHTTCLPKIVVIEYNCHYSENVSIPYDPNFCWKGDSFYGASAKALVNLAEQKGYSLIYDIADSNLFFFKKEYTYLF